MKLKKPLLLGLLLLLPSVWAWRRPCEGGPRVEGELEAEEMGGYVGVVEVSRACWGSRYWSWSFAVGCRAARAVCGRLLLLLGANLVLKGDGRWELGDLESAGDRPGADASPTESEESLLRSAAARGLGSLGSASISGWGVDLRPMLAGAADSAAK